MSEMFRNALNFINEVAIAGKTSAASQAKRAGLTYAGFSNWKDSNGQTVARTVNGQLVWNKKSAPVSHYSKPVQRNAVNGHLLQDALQGIGKSSRHPSHAKVLIQSIQAELLPGEELVVLDGSTAEQRKIIEGLTYSSVGMGELAAADKRNVKLAITQHSSWLSKVKGKAAIAYALIIKRWQDSSPHLQTTLQKEHRDAFLTKLFNGEYTDGIPPTLPFSQPLERGLGFEDRKDFLKFIRAFRKNEIPHSGFTTAQDIGKRWSNGTDYGVIIRTHPIDGKHKALCLSNRHHSEPYMDTLCEADTPETDIVERRAEVEHKYKLGAFANEQEVIFPNSKFKVRSVKKYLYVSNLGLILDPVIQKYLNPTGTVLNDRWVPNWRMKLVIDIDPIHKD